MVVGPRKLVKHIAKSYLLDTSGSLEYTADSISILDLAEHSEISILIPHSDASAYHTMVSNLTLTAC